MRLDQSVSAGAARVGQPFSTIERIMAEGLMVRKRDSRLEPFSRAKLIRGITRAAHLYALTPSDINAFDDRVIELLQPGAPGLLGRCTEPAPAIERTVIEWSPSLKGQLRRC